MSSEDFHPLKVHLEDIISATDNFGPNKLIGSGGFGSVYKGELSLPNGQTMIAFKRLDAKHGQGDNEFSKEIMMLSKYKHENLASLLCFCDEGHERILGYKYASRGSLDRYLELEVALEEQDISQNGINMFELGKLAVPPLSYESEEKHHLLLMKGFRYQDTTWLSVDKNKRVCEIISATKCITVVDDRDFRLTREENSRFDYVLGGIRHFQIKARAQFLIPHVTYNINLLYKFTHWDYGTCLPYKYKLEEETHYSGPFITELREDGWLVSQLYRFTCHQRRQQFTIECLDGDSWDDSWRSNKFFLEGIEFRPVNHETEENNIMDSNQNWEQKFPIDYIDLLELSKENIQWTTKKEAYFLLRQGFLIEEEHGELWFSIDKNMKKRLMIPARACLYDNEWTWKSFPESRFEVVAEDEMESSS
ncbi:hypothetical protein L6452_31923 [Arctium lappa]|uniref:Uncharacterized protein n=1 Tax=Arctium lappa TaxID=4217 RepID=A0ACB8Z2B2_ARCLA|nr:hypothetical protein L6452_31923 [Arctium lappa]